VPTLEELKLARLQYLQELQAQAAGLKKGVERYLHDPVAFARECIDWGDEGGLTFYQEDILNLLEEKRRVSVRGPHGLGKSTIAAITVLWFTVTRDSAGIDWKAVTTAGAWRQLINYLWPEIRKWAMRLKWEKIRDRPFSGAELLNLSLRLKHGNAFAAAASNPALIEGAHADSLLFVYDESKAIVAGTFDACEGAFSGTGESYVVALSTPGPPQGRFYDIQSRKPGYEDWAVKHVTLEDAMRANRISTEWAEQRKLQWGEHSALYQNRVLGEFYAGEEDSVVPLSWVEAAVERWHEWSLAGKHDPGTPHTVGVDVARSGTDKTCMAIRQGHVITEIRAYTHNDTMVTAGRVQGILENDPSMTAIVDVVGVGGGVVDRLREQGNRVQAFAGSARSRNRDRTGELGFINTRAAAWYNLREILDPTFGSIICLPPDDDLLGDLTAPKAGEPQSGGKIKIESKDEIKKRIGRSTDYGDAVVQAFWTEMGNWHDAYGTTRCEGCDRVFLTTIDGVKRDKCPHCQAPVVLDDDYYDEDEEVVE
jgi:hypothetical protein